MRDIGMPLRDAVQGQEVSIVTRETNLAPDVLVTWWTDERETDQEHIGLMVCEWAEPIVTLLSDSIPKAERNRLSVDHHIDGVVVEH